MVSPHPSLYFFLQFLFQLFLMSTLVLDEISMEDPLCDSSFGSMVTLDYVNSSHKKAKGKQPKGGGKQNKGKDKQPQDKNQHKAHTVKGQGNPAQWKQSSGNFQGYCGNCGKWGHPQRECWGEVDQQSGGQHLGKQQLEGGHLQQLR